MRSQGHSTSDINHVYGKQLNGVPARLAYKVNFISYIFYQSIGCSSY
jgi:hypothetical protein